MVELYFGAFLDEILRLGGDVNETAGDGLMVIFQDADPRRHAKIEGAAGTRWTYTAFGQTTNVAARLAALAQSGSIVLSEVTRRRLGDDFPTGGHGDAGVEERGSTHPRVPMPACDTGGRVENRQMKLLL
jgi:class 3 adenylate cyclase